MGSIAKRLNGTYPSVQIVAAAVRYYENLEPEFRE